MKIWIPDNLEITEDDVLRGQGADPAVVRVRRPSLFDAAEEAIQTGLPLAEPRVAYQWLDVEQLRHEKLFLEGNKTISGPLIAQHLKPAKKIVAMVVTIGTQIDARVSEMMNTDPLQAIALEGVGGALTEALANAACANFEQQAAVENLQSSIPLSPGMVGWEVDRGQPEIFSMVDTAAIGVSLTPSNMMIPRKSLSMVIGFGAEMALSGNTCDFCAMKETCNYRDHYKHNPLSPK